MFVKKIRRFGIQNWWNYLQKICILTEVSEDDEDNSLVESESEPELGGRISGSRVSFMVMMGKVVFSGSSCKVGD